MAKQIKWAAEYFLVLFIYYIFKLIPFRLRSLLLSNFFVFLGNKVANTRNRVTENLSLAFPQKDVQWYKKITYKNFYNTGHLISEYVQFSSVNQKFLRHFVIHSPNLESHEKALSKGCLIIGGHLGNIEYIGIRIVDIITNNNKKLYGIAKRQSNPWTERIIRNLRTNQGCNLLYTDESPRRAVTALKQGHVLLIFSDQDAGKKGPFYPFMGRLASTYEGPAFFARLSKVPIYFTWSYHNEQGKIIFGLQEIKRPDIDPKDIEEWNRKFTYTWVKILEEKVHQYPSDYFWLHKRWRHQPENPAEHWHFWHDWERKNGYPLSVAN